MYQLGFPNAIVGTCSHNWYTYLIYTHKRINYSKSTVCTSWKAIEFTANCCSAVDVVPIVEGSIPMWNMCSSNIWFLCTLIGFYYIKLNDAKIKALKQWSWIVSAIDFAYFFVIVIRSPELEFQSIIIVLILERLGKIDKIYLCHIKAHKKTSKFSKRSHPQKFMFVSQRISLWSILYAKFTNETWEMLHKIAITWAAPVV